MNNIAIFKNTEALVIDHYTRHPVFDTMNIHVLQISDTENPRQSVLGGHDLKAPISELDALVESAEVVGFDQACVAWVQQQFPGLTVQLDEPDAPIEEIEEVEEPVPAPVTKRGRKK